MMVSSRNSLKNSQKISKNSKNWPTFFSYFLEFSLIFPDFFKDSIDLICVAPNAERNIIASHATDRTVYLWDIDSGENLGCLLKGTFAKSLPG